MKRIVVWIVKVAAVVSVIFLMLVVAVFFLVQTDSVQQRLLNHATDLLSEELQTKVGIDRISVSLSDRDVRLYGLTVEDLQQRKMLQVEELGLRMKLRPLLHHRLQVTEARMKGAEVLLCKPSPDSVANYQFVVDYFKNQKGKTAKTARADTVARQSKQITFDISRLKLERIAVSYSNGKLDRRLRAAVIDLYDGHDCRQLDIDSLCYITDNHQPRRNFGKPKRGFFDAKHLNVVARMHLQLEHLSKDSVVALITECSAEDIGSGIDVRSLTGKVTVNKQMVRVDSLTVRLPSTELAMKHVNLQLPSKKEDRRLSFSIPEVMGTVLLQDIAHPFAPVLKHFKVPLTLQTKVIGTDDALYFQNVKVATTDKRLTIKASGNITHLKDKHRLGVHFDVHPLKARKGKAKQIIDQFVVKKFMMKQLDRLGDISYVGHFDVRWKEETFVGNLGTEAGAIDFQFTLDEANKYLKGKVRTLSFELGQVMDMNDFGRIICDANFMFDISKPRTAKMRRLKGGKLPIGQVSADIAEANYKKLKFRVMTADINSDGALAEGRIVDKGKFVDLLCKFSFTNTNEMKKTKIVPGIKFHKKEKKKHAK